MKRERLRTTGAAMMLAVGLIASACSSSDEPNTTPTPDVPEPTSTATTPAPDPTQPTPEPTTEQPSLGSPAEQAKLEAAIDELFDENDEGVRIERGLTALSFDGTFVDEATGELFDDARVARVLVTYESEEWVSGGDIEYTILLEFLRLDTDDRVGRYVDFVEAYPDNQPVGMGVPGGEVARGYYSGRLPGLPSFSPEAIERGLRIMWPEQGDTRGLAVVEAAGPYVMNLYAVSGSAQPSVEEMGETLEEIAPYMLDLIQSLAAE